MSRSQYVWVICEPIGDALTGGTPIAAFTVKYECARWIGGRSTRVNVARFRHHEQRPLWLNPETLDPRDS